MNALSTDTRSIGQVLYETLYPGAKWQRAGRHDAYERAAEVIFNRGFRSGEETQKLAAPPPKARELLKRLVELANAARQYRAVQSADNVTARVAAREALDKVLEQCP